MNTTAAPRAAARALSASVLVLLLSTPVVGQTCDPHWSTAFATGLNGPVSALHVFDDGGGPALYAAGDFTSAGGVPVHYVAKWDGSSWSAVGDNLTSMALALTSFDAGQGPQLFAAGSGFVGGGQSVARWDGTAWQPVGAPFGWSGFLASYNGELYTSGGWGLPDGSSYIARWDGHSAWRGVGPGLASVVHDGLVVHEPAGDVLVVVGSLATVTAPFSVGIARWNGASWSDVGGGLNGHANAIVEFDDGSGPALYVGGSFSRAGLFAPPGVAAENIARWNGASWSALGAGLNRDVTGLAVFDDGSGPKLYASGLFTLAGSAALTRIAVWDGSSWSGLGQGITGVAPPGYAVDVPALAEFAAPGRPSRPALYAGGLFQFTDGVPATNLGALVARHPADLNADGQIDFGDYLEFLNLFDAFDPRADFNHDGLVDFADYLEFLNLFDEGC